MGLLTLFSSVMVTLELGRLSSGTNGEVLVNSHILLTSRIFSSFVIDDLRSRAREQNFHVFYLYCHYRTYKGLSAVGLIARLLEQALAGLGGIPEEVVRKFKESEAPGNDRVRPLLRDVVDMLGTVLAYHGRVFICIDALDEFPPLQRPDLLRSLAELTRLSETRLFLTGRPLIRFEIACCWPNGKMVSIRAREEDIGRYITHRLDQKVIDSGLRGEIMKVLPQKALGMYVGLVVLFWRLVIHL